MIDEKDLTRVEQFAKETGDNASLSNVDKIVIAAGVTMAKSSNEVDKVRLNPAKLEEFKPTKMQKYYEEEE